ncbi:MAG: hypothetical protein ACKVP0_26660 [Pirellulaceae bacterium]
MRKLSLRTAWLATLFAFFLGNLQSSFAQEESLEVENQSDLASAYLSDEIDSYVEDNDVDLVNFQQPGTARPPTTVRRPTRRPVTGQEIAPPSSADTGDYLASAPRMFGHYYGAIGQLQQRSQVNNVPPQTKLDLRTDLPIAGGASPLQITDNNTPLPQSRYFVNYNHFENAIRTQSGGRQIFAPVDQTTFGMEQTFLEGISSWQLQLPMTGGFSVPGDPGVQTGQFGNLGFISKTAIWRSDYAILSGGLGLDLPTGSSVQGRGYQLRNTATGVLPFIGLMALPTDTTFFSGFLTASVPAGGNQFVVIPPFGAPPQNVGLFNAQTRLHLDLAGGIWLNQNPGGGGLTGLAVIGEFHYVAATQRGDVVNFASPGPTSTRFYQLANLSNQQTVTNLTLGIHTVWNDRFQFRIGGAFPVTQFPNRGFDGEVIAQMNFIP